MNTIILKLLVANEQSFFQDTDNFIPFGYEALSQKDEEKFFNAIELMYAKHIKRTNKKDSFV